MTVIGRLATPGVRRVPLLAVGVAAVLAVASGALMAAMDLSPTAALIVLTAVALAVPIGRSLLRRQWDPFEPCVAFAVGWGVMFVVRTTAVLQQERYDFAPWPSRHFDIREGMFDVQVLALIGAAAFAVGYLLPVSRRLARRLPAPAGALHPDTVVVAAVSVGLAGMLVFGAFLFKTGGVDAVRVFMEGRNLQQIEIYRSSTAYGYYAPLLVVPATLLLVATGRRLRDPLVVMMGGLFTAFFLVVFVPNGNRIFLLPLFGSLLIYAYVSRGKRPGVATLTAVGVVGLVLSTILVLGRDQGGLSYGDAARHVASHPQAVLDPITERDDAEMAELLAAVVSEDPVGSKYRFGRATFRDAAVRAIPRVLWPEKPKPPREDVIASFWPAEYRAGAANPEFSVMLALWLDLKWGGVAIGLFVLGLGSRLAYEYFQQHRENQLAQLLFAIFLCLMPMGVRDSPVDTFMKACFYFAPIAFVVFVSRVRAAEPEGTSLLEPQDGTKSVATTEAEPATATT